MMIDPCTKCGSTTLEPGILMGAAVQLERAKVLAKVFAGAEVKVRVCLDCGHMDQFQADVEKLRKGIEE